MKPVVAWSWSRLDTFEACPRQFYHKNIIKTVKFEQNEAMKRGERMHTHMENALRSGQVHEEVSHMAPTIEKLRGVEWDDRLIEVEHAYRQDMTMTSWFGKDAWLRIKQDFIAKKGKRAVCLDWKGLALDTPIPTPDGWSTMGELRVGDAVFGADGIPCSVVAKSQVHERDMYRIHFDDTSTVECDNEHLWSVVTVKNKEVADVLNTTQLVERKHQVKLTEPLTASRTQLKLDPYILGVWLGDGKRSSSEVTKVASFFTWLESLGIELGKPYRKPDSKCETRTILGIRLYLRELNLHCNKHIPHQYLRASIYNRLSLLQGLMDTDGTWNKARNQAVFSSTDPKLAEQVYELVVSLGMRALLSSREKEGFGVLTTEYIVSFTPHTLNPFRWPAKAAKVVLSTKWSCRRRQIQEIEYLGVGLSQCIKVDSNDSLYLCGKSMIPTHNTGKNRGYSDQLKLYAGEAMHYWKDVEEVSTSYVFLDTKEKEERTFTRDDFDDIWQDFGDRAERIQIANETGEWIAKPSSMACRFCPVAECDKRK